jgi:hypothetical protein
MKASQAKSSDTIMAYLLLAVVSHHFQDAT